MSVRKHMRYVIPIVILALAITVLLVEAGRLTGWGPFRKEERSFMYEDDGIQYMARIEGEAYTVYDGGTFKDTFFKGVNMGAAKPGFFPGEVAITKEEYSRWFEQIAAMNANSIRVYTVLSPDFYEAFHTYNEAADEPLYLFHGVWVDETQMADSMNAHDKRLKDLYQHDIASVIDIIHGNAELPERPGFAHGSYTYDISPYVAGWILGIEWDPHFVIETNALNKELSAYDGDYLYAENAPAFEVFLTETGDYAIQYETETYGAQRPLSFTNWVTTDTLTHPNEPLAKEDLIGVNTELIHAKPAFKTGLFAAYHVYPYYPDFMSYQRSYTEYIDSDGRLNPYKAYLRDLKTEHSVPVMIAEFGIPASRGMAHKNIHTGFNQGFVSERQQGEMVASMLADITETGYIGGLVFTWQDEWFKRTWNTMDFDLPDQRPFWSNVQTNEQHFGILSFDPGESRSVSYVDGDTEEWSAEDQLTEGEGFRLSMKSDARYVYFYADIDDYTPGEDRFLIALDTLAGSGNTAWTQEGLTFEQPVNFLIQIDPAAESRIMVDAYYDAHYYMYAYTLAMLDRIPAYEKPDSGIFNPMMLTLNRELYLPEDDIYLPFDAYETGLLLPGIGNPDHADYNSLADYYIDGDTLEIRIPWQLLNIMDPSTKQVMTDFYQEETPGGEFLFHPERIESIRISGMLLRGGQTESSPFAAYSWEAWEYPVTHERLKQSYTIIQEAFAALD